MPDQTSPYTGRFAPSPSGPLHFGSLVAALASFLDARKSGGRWLIRIDDIDPPREMPGAGDLILHTLEQHGLTWDGDVLWQSSRSEAYLAHLEELTQLGLIYPCSCTRQHIKAMGGIYNGQCRQGAENKAELALRLKLYDLPGSLTSLPHQVRFIDSIQGEQVQDLALEVGDAVVRRKDGLFGYQLAVVLDDLHQGVTHIVRGADLLPVTARQIRFFEILHKSIPAYSHVPVAAINGLKLSKQNHAPALNNADATINIWRALVFLRQNPPQELQRTSLTTLLTWAQTHWDKEVLKGAGQILPLTPS
ncbi:tRNA glutamyl-Q(34) synthetase GluQRS [Gilvimarinus sp. SDUM040013]|uniref:Glutamyl-Q tRNA(Asp) synthetase n=1 Tax=Gilvimarinus gilvus TaxID=3058038 RepID=A0ABU4S1I8_9GAMM|nr:tRNA glutamyl-Q(34) synthetase GluQRS [Gilvimarinus sp. SDUM040013]MDO3386103.1 tRNA glutamyl-Q(34) synthetase GluQRS [Gilvimarinus sp. SDUM040013]MDX6850356.1 tRNA glutamyl-Q(34) synthetase GluQRS [Gilvimarinus sp. SDUM040013]